jgi:transcriptional regulator with GAF, ATPase, and Fis domain
MRCTTIPNKRRTPNLPHDARDARVDVRRGHMSSTERFPVTAEVVSAITSSLVLDEVLSSVARRTAEVLDLWECDIYEYRPSENASVALALWAVKPHPNDAEWVGSSQDLEEQPIFRRVLTEGCTLANHIDDPDLPQADRSRMEFWREKSCLLVPLIFRDEVIGCLELVEKRHVRRFSAEEQQLAATLASIERAITWPPVRERARGQSPRWVKPSISAQANQRGGYLAEMATRSGHNLPSC